MSNRVVVWVQEFRGRKFLNLQWHDPHTGERKTRTTGTADPAAADQQRADLEYQLNHGLYGVQSKLSWERFREMFQREYAANLRPSSQERFDVVFAVFEQATHPRLLRAITERTLSAFVQGMRERKQRTGKVGLAPITQRNYLIALKTALGWAVHQKLIQAMPSFPSIKVPKKKPQPIPAEAFERLLAVAPDVWWRAYLNCGWWGGLRLSEARHLHWERSETFPWFDAENNRVILPAAFAKSDEDQSVPLHSTLRSALDGLPRTEARLFPFRSSTGRLMNRHDICRKVRAMARRAGVKLTFHSLRKGFGCRVAKQLGKGNAPILHSLMRHSSMQITMDYYASVDDALQDAIKTLT